MEGKDKKRNLDLLNEYAQKLTKEGKTPFTREQLIEEVHKKYPGIKKDSLNPMIQGMTINLKGGAPGGVETNVFYRVKRGFFELYDSNKHDNPHKNLDIKTKKE
ncbi:MAG: hypothetical protein WAX07_02830 [Candidatus Altiarchaeia archaeon]